MKANAPTTLYFRGRARAMAQDLDGALQDFQRCVVLQPGSADALREMAHIYYYRGQLELAKDAVEGSLRLDPTNAGRTLADEIERELARSSRSS